MPFLPFCQLCDTKSLLSFEIGIDRNGVNIWDMGDHRSVCIHTVFLRKYIITAQTKPQTRRFTDNAPILNLSLAFESWKFIIGYKCDGFRFM